MTPETTLAALPRRLGPASAVIVATLLVILGVIVIMHPAVLVWLVGIGLILAGAGVLAATLLSGRQE